MRKLEREIIWYSDMSGELPGEVYRALNVEGEGRAAADSGVVEQRRADLVHHLLQHRNINIFLLEKRSHNFLIC